MRALSLTAGVVALLSWTARAHACGGADLVSTVPADGAREVPLNATLHAHYGRTAEHTGEEVVLEQVGGPEQVLDATFNANEGILTAAPVEDLVAGAEYVVHWPELDGSGTSGAGTAAEVAFTAGSGPDLERPIFDGVRAVAWDVERRRDDCTDSVEERYVFDLGLHPAEDDGGRHNLTLIVFQTAGPGLVEPERVLVRPMPQRDRVRVTRAVDDAVGRVCFAAMARDLAGHVSGGASTEVCAETVRPPFFYGCRTASGRERGGAAMAGLLVLALALGRRRTRVADTVVADSSGSGL